MNRKKICPFLLMGNPANVAGHADCLQERCALWAQLSRPEGDCALSGLGMMPHLVNVIRAR